MPETRAELGIVLGILLGVAACGRPLPGLGVSGVGGAGASTGGVADGGPDRGDVIAFKPLGQPCAGAGECGSGFCVEGVCCESVCAQGCLTCAAAGTVGTCTKRAAGGSPRTLADCPATPPSSCGLDGTCDGAGACRHYLGTLCLAGTCQGGAVVGAQSCDGAGACKPAPSILCAPYACDPVAGACAESCTPDAGCAEGISCTDNSCQTDRPPGQCVQGSDCPSGYCVDSVCCATACQGPCLSCALPGRLGTCSPIGADQSDPRGLCVDQGAASCGQTGACDGSGRCARYRAGVTCAPSSCSNKIFTMASVCDGLGTCTPGGRVSCPPYSMCDGSGSTCSDTL
jgi:hypothetical protein